MRGIAENPVDLFIIGGGVNGCGIARDAAGRGLSVTLAEQGDLAQATSSASTKLFHGGLRYLEYLEIRLVREALHEREVLLRAMPHISCRITSYNVCYTKLLRRPVSGSGAHRGGLVKAKLGKPPLTCGQVALRNARTQV